MAICSIALLILGETCHLKGRDRVTVWRTVLLLSRYYCDSTHQHYDVTQFEYVLWRHTMHGWVMNIHYKTWIAQGRFTNMILTPSKQWGVCDKKFKVTMWVLHRSDSHPFGSMSIGPPIPEIQHFKKIWHWKFKVMVIGVVKVESHNMFSTSSRLTSLSFHVNRASHSWVTTFSKFDLENQGSRSWVRSQFKVTIWV